MTSTWSKVLIGLIPFLSAPSYAEMNCELAFKSDTRVTDIADQAIQEELRALHLVFAKEETASQRFLASGTVEVDPQVPHAIWTTNILLQNRWPDYHAAIEYIINADPVTKYGWAHMTGGIRTTSWNVCQLESPRRVQAVQVCRLVAVVQAQAVNSCNEALPSDLVASYLSFLERSLAAGEALAGGETRHMSEGHVCGAVTMYTTTDVDVLQNILMNDPIAQQAGYEVQLVNLCGL